MDGKPKYRRDNTSLVQVPTENQWHGRGLNSVSQSPGLMHWPHFCLSDSRITKRHWKESNIKCFIKFFQEEYLVFWWRMCFTTFPKNLTLLNFLQLWIFFLKNVLLSVEEHVTLGHTDFSTKLESSKKASRSSSLIFLAKKTLAPLSPQPTEIRVLRVTRRTIFPLCPYLASTYSWCISLSAPWIRGSEKRITEPTLSLTSWVALRKAWPVPQHVAVGSNSSEARYGQPLDGNRSWAA